jgi:hypothetical protein
MWTLQPIGCERHLTQNTGDSGPAGSHNMKSLVILGLFAASLSHAAWQDHEEVRELRLESAGIAELSIDAGAGALEIQGVDGASSVQVTATIVVPDRNADKAAEVIAKYLKLSLARDGNRAILLARFERPSFGFGESPRVDLKVIVPASTALRIDDGSGAIEIRDIRAAVSIDDGSGAITLQNIAGPIRLDDGSGSIRIDNVDSDVHVVDGSGSIDIANVKGSVTIDDGSGSIDVRDVGKDLVILDDGSGPVKFRRILGTVDDRS